MHRSGLARIGLEENGKTEISSTVQERSLRPCDGNAQDIACIDQRGRGIVTVEDDHRLSRDLDQLPRLIVGEQWRCLRPTIAVVYINVRSGDGNSAKRTPYSHVWRSSPICTRPLLS